MTASRRQLVFFLFPWVIGLTVLSLGPLVISFAVSLTNWERQSPDQSVAWVGLQQYQSALRVDSEYIPSLQDPWYWKLLGGKPDDSRYFASLYNSLYFTFFSVPLGLITSLAVALLLNRSMRGIAIIRGMVYLPHLLGGVATVMIWSWLLNPRFGLINEIIRSVYTLLDPAVRLVAINGTSDWPVPTWLYSPSGCKPAVILISIWTLGGAMLIFLAALRRIPAVMYEAARLDGADHWRQLLNITLPHLTPVILFNLIISVIFSMQVFGEAYLLQNRQQEEGLLFSMLYLFELAFTPPYRWGYAAALSWMMLMVTALLIVPLLWSARRWVHESVRR